MLECTYTTIYRKIYKYFSSVRKENKKSQDANKDN